MLLAELLLELELPIPAHAEPSAPAAAYDAQTDAFTSEEVDWEDEEAVAKNCTGNQVEMGWQVETGSRNEQKDDKVAVKRKSRSLYC